VTAAGPHTAAGFFSAVYAAVRAIPAGRVATYGQVARVLGVPRGARAVGWALRALEGSQARTVPWHRVVGAGGRISLPEGRAAERQRRRLRAEGVRLRQGRVDLRRHGMPA
jgi:methylated-DNA-protein-cysteine methyltransferase-like protein